MFFLANEYRHFVAGIELFLAVSTVDYVCLLHIIITNIFMKFK